MQLISKYNKVVKLQCVIDIYSKYALVAPFKDKKGNAVVNAFQKIISDLNRKPNKIWVDHSIEFYNRFVIFMVR